MDNETLAEESAHRSSFSPRKPFMAKAKDSSKVKKKETKREGHLDQQFPLRYFPKVNSLMNSKNQNQVYQYTYIAYTIKKKAEQHIEIGHAKMNIYLGNSEGHADAAILNG